MKKTKHVILAVVSVVIAAFVAFAVGCGCKKKPKPQPTEKKTLQSIDLDLTNAKLLYLTPNAYSTSAGEQYTSDGLVIKATFSSGDKTEVEDVLPTAQGVYIDKTAIKSANGKYQVGTYEIVVYYTYESKSANKSYDIEVKEEAAGLSVVFKKDATQSYTLTKENPTVDLSDAASRIEVRKPDSFGNVDLNSAPLSAGYEVKVYLGKNEVSADKLGECGPGAYQIWASMPYDVAEPDGFKLSAFVIVYVNDVLKSLSFKSGETTQTMGADTMTASWKFTAIFESGIEKELSSSEVAITGVNTRVVNAAGSASVSYTIYGKTANTTVPYVIAKPTGTVTYTVTYSVVGEKIVTTWGESIGSEDELKMTSSVSSYGVSKKATRDEVEFEDYVQIKSGKAISLKFGTNITDINITAYVTHNNTAATARIAYISKGGTNVAEMPIAAVDGVVYPYIELLELKGASTGASSATYLIEATDTMYLYAVEVTYTVNYGSGN